MIFAKLKSKFYRLKANFGDHTVSIDAGVAMNRDTTLEDHIKVYRNTSIRGSSVGRGTYIAWGGVLNNASIGRFCSVGPFAEIIYGSHPTSEFVSTHPAFYSTQLQAGFSFCTLENKYTEFKYAKNSHFSVVVQNDVWIGHGTRIMEGVTIGNGAIVGANSLVIKDLEPYSINVGSPTRCIGHRFDKDVRDKLLALEWWNLEFDVIGKNWMIFDDVDSFAEKLGRTP